MDDDLTKDDQINQSKELAVESSESLRPALDSDAADPEESAFQQTLAQWESMMRRERNILSPHRYFFHAGYARPDSEGTGR